MVILSWKQHRFTEGASEDAVVGQACAAKVQIVADEVGYSVGGVQCRDLPERKRDQGNNVMVSVCNKVVRLPATLHATTDTARTASMHCLLSSPMQLMLAEGRIY